MHTQRNLDDVFAAATRESSPVSEADVHAIITTAGTTPGRPIAMASIIAVSAVAAGIIGYVTMSNPVSEVATTSLPSEAPVTSAGHAPVTSQPAVAATLEDAPPGKTVNVDGVGISVIALDAKNLASLDLDPLLAERLQRIIASVDSMRYCNGTRTTSTVCAWNNGTMQEIRIHDGDGPQPVMFTTHDGKGQMALPPGMTSVDVNALVPVETTTEKGSMLMWFPPTHTLIEKLPDDIAKSVTIMIDGADVDPKTLQLRTMRPDGAATMMMLNVDTLGADASELVPSELRQMLPNLDSLIRSTMSNIRIQVSEHDQDSIPSNINIAIANRNVSINIDSIVRSLNGKDSGVKVQAFSVNDSVRIQLPEGVTTPSRKARIVVGASMFVLKTPDGLRKSGAQQPAQLQELRTQQGALSVRSIYPNPATDGGATLAYELTSDRTLNVDMLDLAGTRVARLLGGVRKRAGRGQLAFTYGDVAPGMYLLHVTTDSGETAVQRIVIQR